MFLLEFNPLLCFPGAQELREMVNLPDTRPEMVPADFEGVTEALKGTGQHFNIYLDI